MPSKITKEQSSLPAGKMNCGHGRRRQAIVEQLLSHILHGRFRAGQRLIAQDLAEEFGVSQTPIREALIQLAGIGIVESAPNRSAVVRRLTPRDVHDLCQVRRALECQATRNACGRIDPQQLLALAEELRQLQSVSGPLDSATVGRALEIDSRLHDLIYASCDNAYLAQELDRLKLLFRTFRNLYWEQIDWQRDFRRVARDSKEHLAIVEALLAGHARDASRVMARHIRNGVRDWSRALREPIVFPTSNGTPHADQSRGSERADGSPVNNSRAPESADRPSQ
jgi:DNA-binding GntR family transcriptional regulator